MKVGIYRRRSTELQKTNASFEVQSDKCLEFVKQNFPKVKKADIIFYDDDAESGQFLDRPSINLMMEDAQNGIISDIVYLHVDRFGRDRYVLATLFHRFKEYGVNCHSVLGVNVKGEDDFVGEAMRDVESIFAVMESKRRTFGFKSGRRKKNQSGTYSNGGKLRWGYYQEKKKDPKDNSPRPILTDPVIKGHYQNIYRMIVTQRYSLENVANELTKQGIKTAYGNEWNHQALSDLLHENNREALCGHITTGRYKYKTVKAKSGKRYCKVIGEYPPEMWGHIHIDDPIYTEEEFDKLREVIKSRTNRGNEPAGDFYLLRELDLRCGKCNDEIRPLPGQKNKQGTKPHYYAASSRTMGKDDLMRYRDGKICPHITTYIPADKVDSYVWDTFIDRIIFDKNMLDELLNVTSKEKKIASLTKEINVQEKDLVKINKKLAKLLDSFLEENFDKDILDTKKKELGLQKREKELSIQKKKREINRVSKSVTTAKRYKTKREELLANMLTVKSKLNGLPFRSRKDILNYVYQDIVFRFLPISKQEAIKLTPEGESFKEGQRFWFTRGRDTGVYLAWDGFIEEDKLLNLLENINNFNIKNIGEYRNGLSYDERYVC